MLTTQRTRSEMVAAVGSAFYAEPQSFQSDRLLREMRTFIRRKDGSAAAAPGSHDDCVMAMGVALLAQRLVTGKRSPQSGISENRNFSLPCRESRVS